MAVHVPMTVIDTVIKIDFGDFSFKRPKDLITLPYFISKKRGRFAVIPEILPREFINNTNISRIKHITVSVPKEMV